jgi:hypothetical protein
MDLIEFRNFERLSRFESWREPIKLAKQNSRMARSESLSAARSNPKWIISTWRESFFLAGIAPAAAGLRRHSISARYFAARSRPYERNNAGGVRVGGSKRIRSTHERVSFEPKGSGTCRVIQSDSDPQVRS